MLLRLFFMNQRTILLDLISSEIDLRSSRMNQRTNFMFICFNKIKHLCNYSK
jgi:hypothetical protein